MIFRMEEEFEARMRTLRQDLNAAMESELESRLEERCSALA